MRRRPIPTSQWYVPDTPPSERDPHFDSEVYTADDNGSVELEVRIRRDPGANRLLRVHWDERDPDVHDRVTISAGEGDAVVALTHTSPATGPSTGWSRSPRAAQTANSVRRRPSVKVPTAGGLN